MSWRSLYTYFPIIFLAHVVQERKEIDVHNAFLVNATHLFRRRDIGTNRM